ncbi:MAG: 2-aminoethylphosphonate--pyruvate transaminase [Rhodospirillaceae bacterium]|jgi:2-aminoethylphosphonate-pyruvate transaminase|nr:2-aminoethylphosphonate--pyruvate transaminase [Rhodospirillaceae bacterium]MBT5244713.1 2-aminoethylphosphonate--pyruvate transaminase [Rhodospirillaceae bacterium]MBT5562454.1 2-aminoethylphosphonate--pyruvate transaminase [Rhodospirillaceae bacterium]MBT6242092.1 2-aminoethylphosphonate--pyruvate transaminase [Rhodospirillaceae bacterium]MBT7136517.1 2-aminoethylphosphonate--pyruvate transaminase [Rhodospirillaceae bacterium]
MPSPTGDPFLLTPGPLTTAPETKQAMLHDWGSRDAGFIETNARVLSRIVAIANAADSHVCVPVQGSGTFAVEATLGTLIPKQGKSLLLVNGAYGHRMAKILDITGRDYQILETPEDTPPNADDVDVILAGNSDIGHVIMVHCETTSGILNPVEEIAAVVANRGRALIIDAMSAFGAIELDVKKIPFEAAMASSNKCLEGVPGMGFAIISRQALEKAKGNAHSLSLDLYDQWQAMEKTSQWRFTPPTHVICAFDKALDLYEAEGGLAGRGGRYRDNCCILIDGMAEMGFKTLLSGNLQAPIIVTFHMPADPKFDFQTFYNKLKDKDYVIYPGKLTVADSFRMGCIGQLGETEMKGALEAVRETLTEMGVTTGAPA